MSTKHYDLWDEVVIKMELMDIIEYMKQLSAKEQRIFKLMLLYDMKLKDISRACNISIDAVKKRLLRARIKLRSRRLLWEG